MSTRQNCRLTKSQVGTCIMKETNMELRKNNTGEHTLDRVVRKSAQKRQNFKAGT